MGKYLSLILALGLVNAHGKTLHSDYTVFPLNLTIRHMSFKVLLICYRIDLLLMVGLR